MGGGRGTRLQPLTQVRCKPAVPLGGKYRLVDIPISNCLNAGYNQIYLLTQFNTESLHRHVQATYRFDYFGGGFVEILSAEQTEGNDSWYQGTADAVRQNLCHIPLREDDTVLILSGDQLYRMDLQNFVRQHRETQADITVAAKAVPLQQAKHFGIVKVEEDLSVVQFEEKPQEEWRAKELAVGPRLRLKLNDPTVTEYCLASMGIYAFKAGILKQCLIPEDHDFGQHVLPHSLGIRRLMGHLFDDYWEDIGTIGAFFNANMMLTDWIPAFDFYNEIAPIYSRPRYLPASKLNRCTVERSSVADGCILSKADLNRCVIGIRSIIREHSQLENVYMMGADHYELETPEQDTSLPPIGIGQRCYIRNAIIDFNARIGNDVRLSPEGKPNTFQQGPIYIRDGILCICKNGIVPDGTIL
jgi:glucose-1-phosphate adenylyltransferase